jgi:hypothetical protein
MTTSIENTPVSVDYTSRDYASLRNDLIQRVKRRTGNTWLGTDPSDFGVAIIEAFAYMGDMINYYIDRVANESYILTATQRQNLLNLASMYGYSPTGYVGANVDLQFTSIAGYQGQIGGSQLVSGVATVITPNTELFEAGDVIIVSGMTNTAYNGNWVVTDSEFEGLTNVVSYKPEAAISGITANGTTIVFTTNAPHQFVATKSIVVSGVTPSGLNGTYTIASVTTTTITVNSTTTGTYVSGGIINYSNIAVQSSNPTGAIVSGGFTVVPAGTQVFTSVAYEDTVQDVVFTTVSNATVQDRQSTMVQAIQGEDISYRQENLANPAISWDINGELIGTSAGVVDQSFSISETRVDKDTIKVYVELGDKYTLWKLVDHLADYGPNDAVYTTATTSDESIFINFGDGVSGTIPPANAKIKAAYTVGGGPIGNVGANSLQKIKTIPGVTSGEASAIKAVIQVTNPLGATGGSNPESNDSIRYNAPKALRALNRAVTLQDYADLALSIKGVGKAKAIAESPNSISLYVAKSVTDREVDPTPGYQAGAVTAAQTNLQETVRTFVSERCQIGATVQVFPPTYIQASVEVSYSLLPQYSANTVEAAINEAIVNGFSYNNVDFADVITPEEIEFQLRKIDGIANVRVLALYRGNGSGRNSLIGSADEIFIFPEVNVTITQASTDATLSNLTINNGTVSLTLEPAFSPTIYEYQSTTNAGDEYIRVVPTKNQAYASITVEDVSQNSGAQVTVGTDVGLTPVTITVVAGSGTDIRTYVIWVNRES